MKHCPFVPVNDLIVIEEESPTPYHDYKGYTHIIVPEKFEHGPEDRMVKGIVLEKGRQCRNAMISIGSKVLIGKWSGARVTVQARQFIFVKEDDVLAILENHE